MENAYDKQQKVWVTLKLSKEAFYRAMDDFPEYEVLEDGSALVSGEFVQGEWLVDMLLGLGEHCEVIEPQWLREKAKERLQRMVELYALR